MSNYYQNHSYNQETAPTEYLQQNHGFSPAYDQQQQQQRVPPYPTGEEYLRQPATAPTVPCPRLPPFHQQQPQPQSFPAQIRVQPAPVHVEQPRIVYVRPRENSHWCVKLCCECMCAIVSSVLYTVLGILLLIVVIALVVYFAKFYHKK